MGGSSDLMIPLDVHHLFRHKICNLLKTCPLLAAFTDMEGIRRSGIYPNHWWVRYVDPATVELFVELSRLR